MTAETPSITIIPGFRGLSSKLCCLATPVTYHGSPASCSSSLVQRLYKHCYLDTSLMTMKVTLSIIIIPVLLLKPCCLDESLLTIMSTIRIIAVLWVIALTALVTPACWHSWLPQVLAYDQGSDSVSHASQTAGIRFVRIIQSQRAVIIFIIICVCQMCVAVEKQLKS